MLIKIKRTIVGLVTASLLIISLPAAHSFALFEGAKDQATCGANLQDGSSAGCSDTTDSEKKVSSTLSTVIGILSIIVGVVSVIMLIIGGMRFVTSNGDGSSTAAARNTIIYAVVGIIIAALAQFIVKFVVGKVAK